MISAISAYLREAARADGRRGPGRQRHNDGDVGVLAN
jgi:hypothetical protein